MTLPVGTQTTIPTPEDEAFDRAFREAAMRELAGDSEPASDTPRRVASPELLARRAAYRRLVAWIVASAGLVTLIALTIDLMT